jgi:ferredoxin
MPRTVYQRLARHLDNLPGGFPPSPDGVEIRILELLFRPDQAELALHLSVIPAPPRAVARRAGIPANEAGRRLDEMARRGLALCLPGKNGQPPLYLANQYVIGIWEFSVNRLTPELVAHMEAYIPTLFERDTWKQAPQLRTIPIGRSLDNANPVLRYDQAEAIVRDRRRYLLAPCICRRERTLAGQGCDRPEETCLIFDAGAAYYAYMGIGRVIDRREALDLLQLAEERAMVLQPGNSRHPGNICICCPCCCGVLRTVRRDPCPSELTGSGYVARWDTAACTACGACLKRCPMQALTAEKGKIRFDPARCIGCGLCVAACAPGALSLVSKPAAQRPKVPRHMVAAAFALARIRGRLGPGRIARILLEAGRDRIGVL